MINGFIITDSGLVIPFGDVDFVKLHKVLQQLLPSIEAESKKQIEALIATLNTKEEQKD